MLEDEVGRTEVLVSWQGSYHQLWDQLNRVGPANPLLSRSSHSCSSQSQAAPQSGLCHHSETLLSPGLSLLLF